MATVGLREREAPGPVDARAVGCASSPSAASSTWTQEEIAEDCGVSRTFFRYFATARMPLRRRRRGARAPARRLAEQLRTGACSPPSGAPCLGGGASLEHDRAFCLARRIVAADPSLRGRSAERFHG